MDYYLAPMEGVTDCIYRTIHHRHFPGLDLYFSPFIPVYPDFHLKTKERRDILPENNEGIGLVPQVLTADAQLFVYACRALADIGWSRTDLNLGCPSGTVVSKGRGAGALRDPEALDRFFDEVFRELGGSGLSVSVKTRIGWSDPAEFDALMAVYRRYPIAELTVHTRTREDQYRRPTHPDSFTAAMEAMADARAGLAAGPLSVCYNGDILAPADAGALAARFSGLPAVMIGRGLIRDPALHRRCRGGAPASLRELRDFHDELFDAYGALYPDRGPLPRMKELWAFMGGQFEGSARCVKEINKAKTVPAYLAAVRTLMGSCPLRED